MNLSFEIKNVFLALATGLTLAFAISEANAKEVVRENLSTEKTCACGDAKACPTDCNCGCKTAEACACKEAKKTCSDCKTVEACACKDKKACCSDCKEGKACTCKKPSKKSKKKAKCCKAC